MPDVHREQLSRLSVHVEIASKINKIIDAKDLTDLGKLEQDLVFGDATSKEIITYISTNQKMSAEDKVCACKAGCADFQLSAQVTTAWTSNVMRVALTVLMLVGFCLCERHGLLPMLPWPICELPEKVSSTVVA